MKKIQKTIPKKWKTPSIYALSNYRLLKKHIGIGYLWISLTSKKYRIKSDRMKYNGSPKKELLGYENPKHKYIIIK